MAGAHSLEGKRAKGHRKSVTKPCCERHAFSKSDATARTDSVARSTRD